MQGIHPTPPSTTKIQIQLQKYKYTRWSRKCRDPTTSSINPFSPSSSGVFLLQRIQVHNVTDLCGQLENSGHTLSCSHVTNRYIFDIFQHHNYGFFQLQQFGRFGGDSKVQRETSEERAHRGGRAQQAQQGEDARRAREHLSVQLGVGGGGGGQEELGPAQPIHHKSQVRLDLTFLHPILGLFVNLQQKMKSIERTKI